MGSGTEIWGSDFIKKSKFLKIEAKSKLALRKAMVGWWREENNLARDDILNE